MVTLPKSGTTWLRVFLTSYFCGLEHRDFTLKTQGLDDGNVPQLVFTHDLFDHAAEPSILARIRGRHLIPPRERHVKPKLLMVRDPRDVIVSLYFELTKKGARPSYAGKLGEMIGHPRFGIKMLVDIMNRWIRDWADLPNFKLVHYENCRRQPDETFRGVLRFLGFREVNESLLKHSMEFSGFENMKRMEAARQFDYAGLSRADLDNPESFRVRRGIVGGYKDYLNPEQILTLESAIARLDGRYGYD